MPTLQLFYICCIALLPSCQIPDKPSTETVTDISLLHGKLLISHKAVQPVSAKIGYVTLTKLVNEAMNKNTSLLASADRLKASQANIINSRSNLLPSINGSGSGNRSRTNEDSAGGDSPVYSGTKSIGVSASWEIDLWKRLRDLNNASTAGSSRFSPIMLTSATTFAGLMPLIFERSIQAQFLIPMAVSVAFGILFATLITLFLIPCAYMATEDIKNLFSKILSWYMKPFKRTSE